MFDEATWAAVAERLKQRALRSVGNVADAQDLAQESMQAALRQDGLSTRADLIGFCLGVLRRQVAAYYRQKRYWRMVPLTATHEPATDIDPSDALVSREATERAAELARHLADADRQLLKLLLSGCPRA